VKDWKRTQHIFMASKLLSSPLEALYGLLGFILCKNLDATPLQITFLVCAKPLVAIISFYVSVLTKSLKKVILLAHCISFLPCLFFPVINNVWYFVFSYALFMAASRAMIPSWAEILRVHLSESMRGKVFSRASTFVYLAHIFVPFLCSSWLDYNPNVWRMLFFIMALIQSLNIFLVSWVRVHIRETEPSLSDTKEPIKTILFTPWKNSWQLIKKRPDFRNFQLVFLLGGGGLILMQPSLPIFFKDCLSLSYTKLALATSVCKGVGFALSAPIWGDRIYRTSIHLFNTVVTGFATAYAVFLISSNYQVNVLFIAYLLYGVMQAGSELSWNLSGTIFSRGRDSTLYTGVNVAMVGIRGCFIPWLGNLLYLYTDTLTVFSVGGILCFFAVISSIWQYQTEKKQELIPGH